MCIHIFERRGTTVLHITMQNSSNNIPSYPPVITALTCLLKERWHSYKKMLTDVGGHVFLMDSDIAERHETLKNKAAVYFLSCCLFFSVCISRQLVPDTFYKYRPSMLSLNTVSRASRRVITLYFCATLVFIITGSMTVVNNYCSWN